MNGDARYWQIAADVCTPKQLAALELHIRHGYGYRLVALHLGISVETARDRIQRALQKIKIAQGD